MAFYPWVRLVLLSELATYGVDAELGQELPGPVEAFYSDLARKHGIWIVPGSVIEHCEGKTYNTTPVISPSGEVVARYRKMFPWYPIESTNTPGSDFCVFDIPDVGRFGVSNCYDMWFPETTRALAFLGAEVVLHPTMATTADRELELILARANAITNQLYFIDINGAGELGSGLSIAVGPEGEVLYQAGERGMTLPVRVDLERVRLVRREGTAGINTVLKSFRESKVRFPTYEPDAHSPSMEALGPLEMRRL